MNVIQRLQELFDRLGLPIHLEEVSANRFRGTINIGGHAVPIVLEQDATGEWRLHSDAVDQALDSLSDLQALLGDGDLPGRVLPADIPDPSDVVLENLTLLPVAALDSLKEVAFKVRSSQSWTVLEDALAIGQLWLDFRILRPLDDPRVKGRAGGVISVGSPPVLIPVSTPIPPDSDDFALPEAIERWKLALEPFDRELALDALARALGGQELAKMVGLLPDDLGLRNIQLTALDIQYDLTRARLGSISLVLALTAAELDLTILDLGDGKPWRLILRLESIKINRSEEGDWTFSATVTASARDWPNAIQGSLPDEVGAELVAAPIEGRDSYDVFVVFDNTVQIPELALGKMNLDLDVEDLRVGFPSGEPVVAADIFVDTKMPSLPFVTALNPLSIKDGLKFRLTISEAKGVEFQLVEWPFRFAKPIVTEEAMVPVDLDLGPLGDFGRIVVELPALPLTEIDSGIEATGMITIEEAAIPLPFLKDLASVVGLGNRVPDRIPLIEDGRVTDDGRLDIRELMAGQGFNEECLPTALTEYNEISLPTEFEYTLEFEPEGALSLGVGFPDGALASHGVTTVVPGVIPLGLKLTEAGLGDIWGLKTMLVTVDADLFNLPYIALCSVLQGIRIPLLPDPKDVKLHITLHGVRLLLTSGIPIPLFYDEIGIHYVGLEGLEFETVWRFPEPSLAEQVALLGRVSGFLTGASDTKLIAADMEPIPELTWSPLFRLGLPKYMGGLALETPNDLSLDVKDVLANTLNLMRDPSVGKLLRAVPKEVRINSVQVNFLGIIDIQTAWAITSPTDFQGNLETFTTGAAKLPEEAMKVVQEIYGRQDVALRNDSLVVLLHGGWSVTDLVDCRTTFGLTVGSHGLTTAFAIEGTLGGSWIELAMRGLVRFDKNEGLQIAGVFACRLFDHEFFYGAVKFDATKEGAELKLEGRLDLFPPGFPLQIEGEGDVFLSRDGTFLLNAHPSVSVAGVDLADARLVVATQALDQFTVEGGGTLLEDLLEALPEASRDEARTSLKDGSLVVLAEILGQMTALCATANGDLHADLTVGIGADFKLGPIVEPNTGWMLLPEIPISASIFANVQVHIGASGVALSIQAGFSFRGKELRIPEFTIGWIPPKGGLEAVLIDRIDDAAWELFSFLFQDGPNVLAVWGQKAISWAADRLEAFQSFLMDPGESMQEFWEAVGGLDDVALEALAMWDPSGWKRSLKWKPGAWAAALEWKPETWGITVAFDPTKWAETIRWREEVWSHTFKWKPTDWHVAVTEVLAGEWDKVLDVFEAADWDDFGRSFGLKVKGVDEAEINDWLADRERAARGYLAERWKVVEDVFGPVAGPLGDAATDIVEGGQDIVDSVFGPIIKSLPF
ncbi:MAG: hypothetical protein JXA14_27770 [Anaerolineae bacterium]|nr:hypothetical protein [Anaerolineae bacterium]